MFEGWRHLGGRTWFLNSELNVSVVLFARSGRDEEKMGDEGRKGGQGEVYMRSEGSSEVVG